jgi:hypothetical protein
MSACYAGIPEMYANASGDRLHRNPGSLSVQWRGIRPQATEAVISDPARRQSSR